MNKKQTNLLEHSRVRQALLSGQDDIQNSIDKSPFGIQIFNIDGELVNVNSKLLDIWGYDSFEDLKKVPFQERFAPDSIELIDELNNLRKQGKTLPRHNMTIIRKDGHLRTLHGYGTEIIWNSERYVQVLYEDVTEKKRIEDILKKEQENFRNSLEISPLGVQIVDSNGELVYANKTMLGMWGYDNFAKLKAVPSNLRFTSESTSALNNKKAKLTAICKNGEKKALLAYPKEIIWNGQLHVQTLYQDISGRKKAEEALRFSNAAFQSIHEGVFAMDNNFIVTHWNAICEKM